MGEQKGDERRHQEDLGVFTQARAIHDPSDNDHDGRAQCRKDRGRRRFRREEHEKGPHAEQTEYGERHGEWNVRRVRADGARSQHGRDGRSDGTTRLHLKVVQSGGPGHGCYDRTHGHDEHRDTDESCSTRGTEAPERQGDDVRPDRDCGEQNGVDNPHKNLHSHLSYGSPRLPTSCHLAGFPAHNLLYLVK